ncbi:MAG: hypothetical protein WBG38_09400 [Nodosilinea sp.]
MPGWATHQDRASATAPQKLEASARQTPVQDNPAFDPLLIIRC